MTDPYLLMIAITLVALAHYLVVGRHAGLLTLDSLFVLTQWLMACGTLAILDLSYPADRVYVLVICVPLVVYTIISTLTHWFLRAGRNDTLGSQKPPVRVYRPTIAVWILLLLSCAITIAYYRAVGYNTLTVGIQGLVAGEDINVSVMRRDFYGGTHYLFPGYVNQFKNAILPALTLVVAIYLFHVRHPRRWLITIPLTTLAVFGILGTGQRGAFIQFILILLVFLFHLSPSRFFRRATVAVVATTPLVFLATLFLARSTSSLADTPSIAGKFLVVGRELSKRVFYDNQLSGQAGFRYTYGQPTQNGAEWLTSILGILPNNPGSSLSSEIFQTLYRSNAGTSPPSLWGSTFYNFGWPGILLLPIALAIIFQTITFRTSRRPAVNALELIGMSGTYVILGNWVAGGPEYLLNAGAVTFAILWWMGRRAAPSRQLGVLDPDQERSGALVRSPGVESHRRDPRANPIPALRR